MPSRARRTRSRERATVVASRCVPDGVDVGRVAQPELHVDGRGDADQLGDLVMADEAAEVVRRLDVDVERDVDRRADRGDLGEREVGREVDRARAELLEHARGGRVRGRQHHRDLRLHVRGEQARSSRARERGEHAEVGDQDAAERRARPRAARRRGGDDLLLPVRVGRETPPAGARAVADVAPARRSAGRTARPRRARRLPRRPSRRARRRCARKTPLPCETRWTATSSRSASSSTASRQRGPSVLGISTRYCAPSGKRSPSRAARRGRRPAGRSSAGSRASRSSARAY